MAGPAAAVACGAALGAAIAVLGWVLGAGGGGYYPSVETTVLALNEEHRVYVIDGFLQPAEVAHLLKRGMVSAHHCSRH